MVRYISRHIMGIIDKESHRFQFTRLSTSYQHAQKLMQFCMHREQILVTIDLPSNANTLRILHALSHEPESNVIMWLMMIPWNCVHVAYTFAKLIKSKHSNKCIEQPLFRSQSWNDDGDRMHTWVWVFFLSPPNWHRTVWHGQIEMEGRERN